MTLEVLGLGGDLLSLSDFLVDFIISQSIILSIFFGGGGGGGGGGKLSCHCVLSVNQPSNI